MSQRDSRVPFTKQEADLIARYAAREGISADEAATRLAQEELAHRVKKRTGKNPARVYSLRKKPGA